MDCEPASRFPGPVACDVHKVVTHRPSELSHSHTLPKNLALLARCLKEAQGWVTCTAKGPADPGSTPPACQACLFPAFSFRMRRSHRSTTIRQASRRA